MSHIEIDKQTIKALSADARIRILKILHKSRRIAADISKEIGLAPSTVNEHLKVMEASGLVRKNDTGHKWIYYDITEKGKNLIAPKMPISIILTLSIGIVFAFFGAANFFAENVFYQGSGMVQSAMEKSAEITEQVTGSAAAVPAINWLSLTLVAVGIVMIVFSFIKLKRK